MGPEAVVRIHIILWEFQILWEGLCALQEEFRNVRAFQTLGPI